MMVLCYERLRWILAVLGVVIGCTRTGDVSSATGDALDQPQPPRVNSVGVSTTAPPDSSRPTIGPEARRVLPPPTLSWAPADGAGTARTRALIAPSLLWRIEFGEDTTFAQPISLATDGELLYVADPPDGRVVALDLRSAAWRWTYGRRGQGPDELSGQYLVSSRGGPGVWILSTERRRAIRLSSSGQPVLSIDLRAVGNVRRFCALSETRFASIISTGGVKLELVLHDAQGMPLRKLRLPWPDLVEASYLAVQGMIEPGADGQCLLALQYADRMVRVIDTGFADTARTIERFENPLEVRQSSTGGGVSLRLASRPTHGVQGMALLGGTWYLSFGGQSGGKRKLVDLYRDADLAYEGSLRFSEYIHDLTGTGDILVLLSSTADGLPALTAFRLAAER